MVDVQRALPRAQTAGVPTARQIQSWSRAALDDAGRSGQVAVRIVGEAESAELNQTYRGKRGPTNVLSFPLDAPKGIAHWPLGDIVICAPVVAREAAEQGKTLAAHWSHMVVHGTLHLLGFDHIRAADARVMEGRERAILAELGFADPYREQY